MASAEQLKALIKSHISRDDSHFYSVAMQVAAHEAKQGHGRLAEELLNLLDKAKAKLANDKSGKLVPLANAAKNRTDLGNLLNVSQPAYRLSDVVLDDSAFAQLQRLVREQRMVSRIKEHGLSPRRKVLLVGPPGTGKTMTASALAGELGIPLFQVRFDALITKFMGETAAKLRQIFDAIADIRGVYFFDEFDAIGSQRSLANDVGEIRRVLNSFLQMIEQDTSNSIIIAATNHPEILDYALFRRFDDVIEYHLPTLEQALDLIRSRLGPFSPKPFRKNGLEKYVSGLSYAEICRAVDESIKDAIMNDHSQVDPALLKQALEERRLISRKLSINEKISQTMTEQTNDKRQHLTLPKTSTSQLYKAHASGGGSSPTVPELDRQTHGQALSVQLQQVKAIAARLHEAQNRLTLRSGIGVQVEFVGQPHVALAFESLGNERGRNEAKRIEVLSVHTVGNVTSANVFIPEGKIAHFEGYIQDYLTEKHRVDGVAADHKSLINTLSAIRLAGIKSLWTDDLNLLPADLDEEFWWEVWLPSEGIGMQLLLTFIG